MAVTQNTYTGNGSQTNYSFTFPYLNTSDILVSVSGVNTTAYTLANATTVAFNTAPANGAAIRIYRKTSDASLAATFYPGSAIRSQDLNNNLTQNLYVIQEVNNYAVLDQGSVTLTANYTFSGTVSGPTPTSNSNLATKGYVDALSLSGTIPDGNRGDVTVSSSGTVWTLNGAAKLDTAQSFTKAQRGEYITLTDAATVAVDLSLGNNFQVTLAGNRTLGAPTNVVAGQSGVIRVIQDATGSRTLAYNSVYKFPGGTAPTLTTTASAVDLLAYHVESATRIAVRFVGDVK